MGEFCRNQKPGSTGSVAEALPGRGFAGQRPAAGSWALPASSGSRQRSVSCESGAERVSLFCLRSRGKRTGFRRGDGGMFNPRSGVAGAGEVDGGCSAGSAVPVGRSKTGYEKKRSGQSAAGLFSRAGRRYPYLVQRGIDCATADEFGVGFFRGSGLMRGRVAIPIHDEGGRLVAYCGRAVDGSEPRYRFPAGFQKSRVLFNYHRALGRGSGQAVLVEGFFDCMRVHQAGFACVALMGVQLSDRQKEQLVRGFHRVVVLMDGDDAGRAANERIARALTPVTQVTQVHLDAGVQPDQMAVHQIRHLLAEAEGRSRIGSN